MTDLSVKPVYAKDTRGQEHKLLVYGFRGNDESGPWARLAVEIEKRFYEASLYEDGTVFVDKSGVWPYMCYDHKENLIALYRGAFCRPATATEVAQVQLIVKEGDGYTSGSWMDFVLYGERA